ncbi:MAG: beta-lactamase family protein [Cyclobacteriaceae bacterium]|nr:beta-lactamase family protein [Cyclobacteriaceae bacterium]
MKQLLLGLVLIGLISSCTKNEKPSTSQLEHQVDSLVQPYLDSAKLAGMAVAVYRGNEKILLKSYGYADLEWNVELPVNASFEIGSVTKQFTGASILLLAEEGKLSLDDEMTKYITYDTKGRKVTIRQLLSHTSGIKSYTDLPFFEHFSQQHHERDTLLRILEKEGYDFEPGEMLHYNNSAFFMLGLIIEKVSGMAYEEFVKKNLFDKAGMGNSYYCSESKIIKNKAHGYDTGEDGLVNAAYLDQTWPYAAGSLCSTAEDLIKWNQALHHGKILSDESYKEFLTPVSLNDGAVTHYAKGITITNIDGRRMIEHGGGINGFLSENCYYPDEDLNVVVLVNTTGPVSPSDIAEQITNFIVGNPVRQSAQFEGDVSKYMGSYKSGMFNVEVTKNDSTISVQYSYSSRAPYPLYFKEGNTWSSGPSLYHFIEKDGVIDELRIDQTYGYYILNK